MDPYYGLISAKLPKLLEVWKMDNCGTSYTRDVGAHMIFVSHAFHKWVILLQHRVRLVAAHVVFIVWFVKSIFPSCGISNSGPICSDLLIHNLFHGFEQAANYFFLARLSLRRELASPPCHRCVPLYSSVGEPNLCFHLCSL